MAREEQIREKWISWTISYSFARRNARFIMLKDPIYKHNFFNSIVSLYIFGFYPCVSDLRIISAWKRSYYIDIIKFDKMYVCHTHTHPHILIMLVLTWKKYLILCRLAF